MEINSVLFAGLSGEETESAVRLLCSPVKNYGKDEVIIRCGSTVQSIGIVASGSVRIESIDIYGNNSILSIAGEGDIFAEAYACTPDRPIMVDVTANEECEVLFLSVKKLFDDSINLACKSRIIRNLLSLSSRKNILLSQRIFHTSSKTIRGRLLSYFSQEIAVQGSRNITIPFSRQQLADYLSLDRSALSKELGKMKADGILDYHKNNFVIFTEEDV